MMNKFRKGVIITLFFVFLILLGSGFYVKENVSEIWGHRLLGTSMVTLFFILMPVFIYHRWKDKNVKDYMLTSESFERMKQYNEDKTK